MRILITGGTVFVSRYVARYYVKKGCDVYVLNRNLSGAQEDGVTLLEADRHGLGELNPRLDSYRFDAILDMTAYTREDVEDLLSQLGSVEHYILLSSSAVYPETLPQPFTETEQVGPNRYWGAYGIGKYQAEQYLFEQIPEAYAVRPPYLYGPMNNLYREAFVFDCALMGRPFYLPNDGQMRLQFFYIDDLCRFIDVLLEKKPTQHVFNLGNYETISIKDWVKLCYSVVREFGLTQEEPELRNVFETIDQRMYFSFYDYEYRLDVSAQQALLPELMPMTEGLRQSFQWYREHSDAVRKKPFFDNMNRFGWN